MADVSFLKGSQRIWRENKRTTRTLTLELEEGKEDEARGRLFTLQNMLELPEGVVLQTDDSRVIVSIAHSRVADELDEAEAEAAEAEDRLIEDLPSEPEVIGRAKDEEEEDDDA